MSLRPMFDNVVNKYDFINRLLTAGLDKFWRQMCAKECASARVTVDLCCGTGDLTLNVKRFAPEACILGVDFSKVMLRKTMKKIAQRQKEDNGLDNVVLILADAGHLPFKDECVDRVGISFSFRNLVYNNPDTEICLKEILRTLHPKGKFVCVETSQPTWHLLRILYHLYLRKIVPLIGGFISGHKGAYHYLGLSARNFPTPEEIAKILFHAGFSEVSVKKVTLGVIALHVAVK